MLVTTALCSAEIRFVTIKGLVAHWSSDGQQRHASLRVSPKCLRRLHVLTILLAAAVSASATAAVYEAPGVAISTHAKPVGAVVARLGTELLPSIAVAAAGDSSVSVLVRTDPYRYAERLVYHLEGTLAAMAASDVTGDGIQDLLVAEQTARTTAALAIFTGRVDGTFAGPTTFPINTQPSSMAVADFNQDGQPDVAIACRGSNTVDLLFNFHNGAIWVDSAYPTGSYPTAVTLGDLNRDGHPDVAVANSFSNSVTVLLYTGSNGFTPASPVTGFNYPDAVGIAEVTGDSLPDLAVVNAYSNSLSILPGAGNGTFGPARNYPTGLSPDAIATGDVTADGLEDIAVADGGYYDNGCDCYAPCKVEVFAGRGVAGLADPVSVSAGNFPTRLVVADADGDGQRDLLSVNQRSNSLMLVPVREGGQFGGGFTSPLPGYPADMVALDANGDGMSDVLVLDGWNNAAVLYLNQGGAGFSAPATYPTTGDPLCVAVADLTGDGRLDLVVGCADGNLNVFRGMPGGLLEPMVPVFVGGSLTAIATGDLDLDGRVDVVTTDGGNYDANCDCTVGGDSLVSLHGDGHGGFQQVEKLRVGHVPRSVALADVTAEGLLDVVVACQGSYGFQCGCFTGGDSLVVLRGEGNGRLSPLATMSTGIGPSALVVGDLTGDGAPDIVISEIGEWTADCNCYAGGSDIGVYVGSGHGSFGSPMHYAVTIHPTDLTLEDLNGDLRADLVVAGYGGNACDVFFGGQASLVYGGSYGTHGAPLAVCAGRFTPDSLVDIAAADLDALSLTILPSAVEMPDSVSSEPVPQVPATSLVVRARWGSGGLAIVIQGRAGATSEVQLVDVSGAVIRRAFCRGDITGRARVSWAPAESAARSLQSGVYFVRVSSEGEERTTRCLVVR